MEINPTSSSSLIVASIYNHPNKEVPTKFIELVDSLARRKPTILVGDFNCPAPEFGSRTTTKEGEKLVEVISKSSLMYVENDSPTYISNSTGDWNLLDLIFVIKSLAEKISSKVGDENQTDHFPLIVKLANGHEFNGPGDGERSGRLGKGEDRM